MRNGGNFIIIYNTNVIFMFNTKKWHNLLKICSPQSDSYGQLGHNLTAHYLNSKEKKRIRKNRGWEALPYSLQRNMINVDYRVLFKKAERFECLQYWNVKPGIIEVDQRITGNQISGYPSEGRSEPKYWERKTWYVYPLVFVLVIDVIKFQEQ